MRKYENNNLIGYQPCDAIEWKWNKVKKLLIIEWYKFVYQIQLR